MASKLEDHEGLGVTKMRQMRLWIINQSSVLRIRGEGVFAPSNMFRKRTLITCLKIHMVWSVRERRGGENTYWQNGPYFEIQCSVTALRLADGRLTVSCKSRIVLEQRISRSSSSSLIQRAYNYTFTTCDPTAAFQAAIQLYGFLSLLIVLWRNNRRASATCFASHCDRVYGDRIQ